MSKHFPFRRKDFVEILQDINCIPKGVYKFEGIEDDLLWFRIKRLVVFAISSDAMTLMRRMPRSTGIKRLMEYEQFQSRYYALAAEHNNNKVQSGGPRSMAMFLCPDQSSRDEHESRTLGAMDRLN